MEPSPGVYDDTYISKIADYVDSKMKSTAKESRIAARDKVAILAAMSITSELFEKKEELDRLKSNFEHETIL